MGYWRQIAIRAWAASRKAAKIDTREALGILVGGQALLAAFFWYTTGDAGLAARIGATALPFLLLFPLFAWKFLGAPAELQHELVAANKGEIEVLKANYESQVTSLRGEIIAGEDDRKKLENEIATLRAPPLPPARDPDAIYQHGRAVGKVTLPNKQIDQSIVTFSHIYSGDEFAPHQAFDYHDLILKITACQAETRAVMAGSVNRSFVGAICQIVGRR
jgi:hypothetical protein